MSHRAIPFVAPLSTPDPPGSPGIPRVPEPELRSGLVIRHGGDLKQIQGLGEAMDTPMDHQGKHQAVVNEYRVGGDRHTHTLYIYIYMCILWDFMGC